MIAIFKYFKGYQVEDGLVWSCSVPEDRTRTAGENLQRGKLDSKRKNNERCPKGRHAASRVGRFSFSKGWPLGCGAVRVGLNGHWGPFPTLKFYDSVMAEGRRYYKIMEFQNWKGPQRHLVTISCPTSHHPDSTWILDDQELTTSQNNPFHF